MEDIHNVDKDEETTTTETTTETVDEETESTTETETSKDIDYEKELERVSTQKQTRSELEKAQRALHFNAQRLKELGGDPADALGIKPVVKEETDDIDARIERTLLRKEIRDLVGDNEAGVQLYMHYIDKGLTVEEAHLLVNKGKIARSIEESKRGNVRYTQVANEKKAIGVTVPERSQEEVILLARRGLAFNPKTKTYQGKIYEEYYDQDEQSWKSRRIRR